MNILLVLIPVTGLVVLIAVALFFWAVNHQQFDDLDSPAVLPLLEDEPEHRSSKLPTPVPPRAVPHASTDDPMPDTTLNEETIARLVDHFYDKVIADPVIGPVFNAVVHDWPAHKRLLTSFWCSVALRANSYRGNPMAAHRPLPVRAEHFDHWLDLWRATCAEELDEEGAAQMIDYAQRIGRSLKYGLGLHPDARGIGVPLVSVRR